MIVRDQKEDWVARHTLTEQDVRKLILEKIERAKLLQSQIKNRKLEELA